MNLLRKIILILFFCQWLLQVSGQNGQLSTQNKRAEKLFFTAIDAYQARKTTEAVKDLEKALDLDPYFTEAHILMGDICSDEKRYNEAIDSYQKALKSDGHFAPGLYMIVANLQLITGKYPDARLNFRRFLENQNIPNQKRQQAEEGILSCDFAITAIDHAVPFTPINLGDSINSPYDEYINALTADEEWLYFTRKNPRNALTIDPGQEFEEDFYIAERADTNWQMARNLGEPINTHGNEGALSISPDGKFLFFAACNREDGFGSCDLYWARWVDNRWTIPKNLGPEVNSPQWDSQPSFSSDGKTLYFASKRSGGKGGSDIWYSRMLPGEHWTVPVNMGDSVNTRLDEMAPFIHPDDQTLYFASKGHRGMGGYDLFLSRKSSPDPLIWKKPVNLGYPINTFSDEITLMVNARGDLAYISSDKFGGKGRQDVYRFPLYKEARPLLTTYFKGIVFNAESMARLGAAFELTDLETRKVVAESHSDGLTGEFLLVLPTERNYALNVSKDGFLFFSENFHLTGTGSQAEPFIKNVPLKPIRLGESVVLKNIFFDTDKYELRDESFVELDKLLDLLRKNPSLKIEISGHTDIVGSNEHNLELSTNRAKAVFDFLVKSGISQSRLNYKGYGFSKPIDSNDSEEGRANNRRTEFKVIGN